MEEVERTSAVMTHPQQRVGSTQINPYTIDVDRKKRRNCYNCRRFGYIARHCRNKRIGNKIGEGRRLKYRENKEQRRIERVNGEQDLILLD